MLINYLKIALRNILKHPRHSVFNILGLSIGMAAAIIILAFIMHELSYDDFHKNKERIYRMVARVDISQGKTLTAPIAHGFIKDWAEEEFPSIESVVRIDRADPVFYHQDREYRGNTGYYTDSTFLETFTFRSKLGHSESALHQPDDIVLVEDMAYRIFGEANPLGKTLSMGEKQFTVAGVLEEIPPNSHMKFDFLLPMVEKDNMEEEFRNRGISIYTYILFRHKVDEQKLNEVSTFIEEETNKAMEEVGIEVDHFLQPMKEVHLNSSTFQYTLSTPGSMNNIYTLSALTVLLILIAVINYVNLETARSDNRTREIGMRKVSGASKKALVGQFLGESLLLSFIAFLVSLLLVELFVPDIEQLLQREFHQFVFEPGNVALYILIIVFIGLLAGFYPAIYLAGFSPVRIFKGSVKTGSKKNVLRKLLVVVQFCIATFLIINLLFIRRQINFVKDKDLGFAQEQVLVLRGITDELQESYFALSNELASLSGVQHVTGAQYYPGDIGSHQQLRMGKQAENGVLTKHNRIQDGYRETLDIKMKTGRYFREDLATDSNKYVINEKALDYLGLEDPIGKEILLNDESGRIIGLMENYHVEGLQKEIMSLIHTRRDLNVDNLLIRVDPENLSPTMEQVERLVKSYDETYHFDYIFLDQYFDNMYEQEERIHTLSMAGSGLAILISILGLYALSLFVVISRTKEIGIRKAMGASGTKVALFINGNINKWVLLANILAWPLSYLFLKDWISNFAYHIDISIHLFILGTLIALVISVLTISYHTLMAARINPAETLRDE